MVQVSLPLYPYHGILGAQYSSGRPAVVRPWKEYGRYGSIGIELVASVLIGLWVGQKGDARWNTSPWFTLLGIAVGSYAGFRALFATVRKMDNDIARAQERTSREDATKRRPPNKDDSPTV